MGLGYTRVLSCCSLLFSAVKVAEVLGSLPEQLTRSVCVAHRNQEVLHRAGLVDGLL